MDSGTWERGEIDVDELAGGMDLYATIESGQSYGWRREDGGAYAGAAEQTWGSGSPPWGDDPPWYWRVVDGEVLRVRQVDGTLEWSATAELEDELRRLLRLDDDLPAILGDAPDDELLADAVEYAPGLRLVRDPPFETLVAFVCSTQMRVSRIHGMVCALADEYGEAVTAEGETYRGFPDPEALAAATEAELRDLGLGYRAPYVVETAEMVADGELHPAEAADLEYEAARELLTEFVGVGDKVADCVCLFSLGFLGAVPLDTWIQTAIGEHFPDCERDGYAETSRAIRERFGVLASAASEGSEDERCESSGVAASGASGGSSDASDGGEYAGYVQTYVFHYLRTRG